MARYVDKFIDQADSSDPILIRDNEARTRLDVLESDSERNKLLIISDSYGDGWSPDGSFNSFAAQILEEIPGYKTHEGGAAFAHAGQLGHTYEDLLRNFVANYPADVPTIGTILVAGGCNDLNESSASIELAIEHFVAYVNTIMPEAEIKLAYISFYGYSGLSAFNKILPLYQTAKGTSYLTNAEYILNDRREISSDGIHPIQSGHNALAHFLIQGLKEGSIDRTIYATDGLTITAASGVTMTVNDGYKRMLVKNGQKTILIPSINFAFSPAVNVGDAVTVGTWSSPYLNGAFPVRIPVTLAVRRSSDNLFQTVSGYIALLANHNVAVELRYANNTSGWATLNANLINIYEPTIGPINVNAPMY